MMKVLARLALAGALIWLPLADASAAVVQITVKDAGGTTRNINVTTNTDITGNLSWNNVICDQSAGTTCASVGTAGSPSTNALTVQAVTLGHGTAANAMRVELPTDGTGVIATVSAVTAISNALPAGTNLMGKVGIDQTTPGTTNGVQVNAALPAGTNLMGKVGIDQTTVGTTNGVSLAQIGANAVAAGNGVSGTGVQRVAIASDNTAFSVNATLQASSATAIGTVNPTTAANWGVGTSTQNSSVVANGQLALAQFNTSPTAITNGNMSPLQLDNAGNLLVNIKAGAGSGGTAFQDNAAWSVGTTNFTPTGGEYTSGGATNCTTAHACTVGMTIDRKMFVDLEAMGGTAIASGCTAALNGFSGTIPSTVCGVFGTYVLNSIASQTIAGVVTNPVAMYNGANKYNTIAASQTTQALTGGGGGATGDYLSHCDIIPATTAPGVVTILDNATSIVAFPGGGTTPLSNLVPWSVPMGAVSTSGAWKVTTGANVSVVCVGKFTALETGRLFASNDNYAVSVREAA